MATIAGYAMREALRRRVFLVVFLLTVGFLGLYWFGVRQAFSDTVTFAGGDVVDAKAFTGATVFGLSMFATLFLGTVLAVFLTLGAVRGDAERGLLQPLLVRPVSRAQLIVARMAAASAVCAGYTVFVYVAAMLITGLEGDWWPDHVVGPALALGGAVTILAAISMLGSVLLSPIANGIAVFMVFGAGLTAGLLGQIAEALHSKSLEDVAEVASWLLPFEALYQAGLNALASETSGITGAAITLGPFGGAKGAGPLLVAWSIGYLGAVVGIATLALGRRDL